MPEQSLETQQLLSRSLERSHPPSRHGPLQLSAAGPDLEAAFGSPRARPGGPRLYPGPGQAAGQATGGSELLQLDGEREKGSPGVHQIADAGFAGPGQTLPHLEQIQRAFGRHDVSQIKAHTDEKAVAANQALGANAFASGTHVALKDQSLHTAAHEAAHIIQQQSGLSLPGGVGQAGDVHERHADQVADRVVQGQSAQDLLDQYASPDAAGKRERAG